MRLSFRAFVLTLLAVASVQTAHAQLSYDGTTFIHGYGDSGRWSDKDIPLRFNNKVVLGGDVRMPNISTYSVDWQSRTLRGMVNGPNNVLVGHSMGGLVARNLVLSPFAAARLDAVAGIVTVATPHQGAPIAANAQRMDPAYPEAPIYGGWVEAVINKLLNPLGTLVNWIVGNILNDVKNYVFNMIKSEMAKIMGANSPGALDIRPGTATINYLNGTADTKNHAQIIGRIPAQDAWITLAAHAGYKDPAPYIKKKNNVLGPLKTCKKIFYNFIVKTVPGRMCHSLEGFIKEMDVRWNDWTHGPNKSAPSDGFIPEDHAKYPQAPSGTNVIVPNVSHFSIVYAERGIDGVADGMKRIGMQAVTPPPPPPPPPGGGDGDPPGGGGGEPPDCESEPGGCPDEMRRGDRRRLAPTSGQSGTTKRGPTKVPAVAPTKVPARPGVTGR